MRFRHGEGLSDGGVVLGVRSGPSVPKSMMMGKGQQMHIKKLTSIRPEHSQTVVKEGFLRLCVKHSNILNKLNKELN